MDEATSQPTEDGEKGREEGRVSPVRDDSASIPPPAGAPPESPGSVLGRVLRAAAPQLSAAWTLTAAVLLGVIGGRWLDNRLGTAPWLMLLATLAGIVVGLYGVARVALKRPPVDRP